MHPTVVKILKLADRGEYVDEIAEALELSERRVYNVLAQYRPDRPRKPRTRTSDIPAKVLALDAKGRKPARIAELLGVTRQYVYKVLAEFC